MPKASARERKNMKKIIYIIVALIIVIVGAIFINKNKTSQVATITGNVYYLQRIALAPGSKVEVNLQDTSLADAPAKTLGSFTLVTTEENVPIPFSISYNPKDILAKHTYTLRAKITQNGELAWTSDTNIPVITNGNPTQNIEIKLVQVTSSAAGEALASTTLSLEAKKVTLGNDANLPSLFERNYVIESVNEKGVPANSNYTVAFKDGKIHAKICNNLNGSFQLSKTTITSPNLISTMMYCEGKMDTETAFAKLFSGVGATFNYSAGILTLANQGQGVTITLKEVN